MWVDLAGRSLSPEDKVLAAELKALVVYGGRFGPTLKRMAYKQLPRLRFETVRPPDDWTTRRR